MAEAASVLVKENLETVKSSYQQQRNLDFFRSILPASVVLAAAVVVGTIAGVGIPKLLQPPQDPAGPRQLSLEEASALQWVKSDDGQLAKNIMEWNGDYLKSGQCETDVHSLGVTLSVNNSKAEKGFCILWIKPFSERNIN